MMEEEQRREEEQREKEEIARLRQEQVSCSACSSVPPVVVKNLDPVLCPTVHLMGFLSAAQVHKAQPIRHYKPVALKKSEIPLTVPHSPNFSDRFRL